MYSYSLHYMHTYVFQYLLPLHYILNVYTEILFNSIVIFSAFPYVHMYTCLMYTCLYPKHTYSYVYIMV